MLRILTESLQAVDPMLLKRLERESTEWSSLYDQPPIRVSTPDEADLVSAELKQAWARLTSSV